MLKSNDYSGVEFSDIGPVTACVIPRLVPSNISLTSFFRAALEFLSRFAVPFLDSERSRLHAGATSKRDDFKTAVCTANWR